MAHSPSDPYCRSLRPGGVCDCPPTIALRRSWTIWLCPECGWFSNGHGMCRNAFAGHAYPYPNLRPVAVREEARADGATPERKRCPLAKPCEDVRICTCGVDNRPTPTETPPGGSDA